MDIILYGLFFITGWLTHASYTYVLTLGSSALSIKQSIDDCLLLLGSAYEKIIGMNELMYKGMADKGIDESEIKIHKRMDKTELQSLMDIAIYNLKGLVPSRLEGAADFHDWNTANKQITKIIKLRRQLDKNN